MRNKKSFLTLGIIVLVLFLGVGYAVVSSVYLNIGGTANVANTDLNVEITNAVATTSVTGKNVDFKHQLSNKNLTSNFTLKEMELNEIVSITYTVTNNEKDIDAVIASIGGVELENSNPDFFTIDYEITDAETDLENDDKTMEVVVTVKLVKTPVTEEESYTLVSMYLAAVPKGVDPSTIKLPDGINDVLDNSWPIEWNTSEVLNNTTLLDGELVRVSRIPISYEELQLLTVEVTEEEQSATFYFLEGEEYGSACGAFYANEDVFTEFVIISVKEPGDYTYSGMDVTVTEPGVYVMNAPSDEYNIDIKISKRNTLVRFGEKYYVTTFWGADIRKNEGWIIFYEDGTSENNMPGLSFPELGYNYSENYILNSSFGVETIDTPGFLVTEGGKYLHIDGNDNAFYLFTVESEFNILKEIPITFGNSYYCTVDNVNNGESLGDYYAWYPDGSGEFSDYDGETKYFSKKEFHFYSDKITSDSLESGESLVISDDGNTVTLVKNGEIMYVYINEAVSGFPISWRPDEIIDNTKVNIDYSLIDGLTENNSEFTKVTDFVPDYGVMLRSVAGFDYLYDKEMYFDSVVKKDQDAYIIKYTDNVDNFYAIVIPTAGQYFGATFIEPGVYVSGSFDDYYNKIDFTFN